MTNNQCILNKKEAVAQCGEMIIVYKRICSQWTMVMMMRTAIEYLTSNKIFTAVIVCCGE